MCGSAIYVDIPFLSATFIELPTPTSGLCGFVLCGGVFFFPSSSCCCLFSFT